MLDSGPMAAMECGGVTGSMNFLLTVDHEPTFERYGKLRLFAACQAIGGRVQPAITCVGPAKSISLRLIARKGRRPRT